MTELLTATAPVFKVDGQVRGEFARDVSRLEIEEATDGLKSLTLRLIAQAQKGSEPDEQLIYLDGSLIDFGKAIEVSIGPGDAARIVFNGLVSGIEAQFPASGDLPHVVVYAEDKLMSLRMTRRLKTWEQMSDADIAAAIAAEHGLQSDVSAPGPTYDVVQQWNQSDLAFLRERARLIQAEVWFEDEQLKFKSRSQRSGTEITLIQGGDKPDTAGCGLLDVQLRADLAHQRTTVRTSGYDASARDKIDEEAGADAIDAEISGGRTGPQVLQQPFGERVSYRVRENPLVAEEASAWARAEMLRRCRSFVTAVGTTNGTPDMVVGSRLTLSGVGAPFNGDGYCAVRVCHTYDLKSGHRTHFEAQRATINAS
jgi:Bacteriophage probable baseplate hub protein